MYARIETLETLLVAFIRHTGPYDQVGSAWHRMYGWAGTKGLLGPKAAALGLCHDDPACTPTEALRYDACIVVDSSTQADGEVGVKEIEGGRYAVATHVGPYTELGDTYGKLMGEWMAGESLEPAPGRPCVEIYRNNPQNTPVDQLRTEVYVPIKE